MIDIETAKRIKALAAMAVQYFDDADWKLLESVLPSGTVISQDDRLYQSHRSGGEQYLSCVSELMITLAEADIENLSAMEQYIDELYQSASRQANADEGRLAHSAVVSGPCRLFISPKSEDKETASALKEALASYGIDCFVAHEDIEVSAVWRECIQRELENCNALLYLSSNAANSSEWCQQEIGWALGRGIPVIPVFLGDIPKALLESRQALNAGVPLREEAVAESVFDALIGNRGVSHAVVDGLVGMLEGSRSFDYSCRVAELLGKASAFSADQAVRIEAAIEANSQVQNAGYGRLPARLLKLLDAKAQQE